MDSSRRMARRDILQVSLVTTACLITIVVMTTFVLHVQADLAMLGPAIVFLGYRMSRGWTPVPEWNPSLYWSVSIILTTLVELFLAYRY